MKPPHPLLAHMSVQQLHTMLALSRGEEGEFFQERLRHWQQVMATMPRTRQQDGLGDNAVVHLHYFHGGCDWWITELDVCKEQYQAFGYADMGYPELGYINLVELIANGVELDIHWQPKTLAEVKAALQSA